MLILDQLKDTSLFTMAEKDAVEFILKNPKEVIGLTVDELAEITYSSPSSIVRLCKKVGLKGFADFKIKLATEINTFVLDENRVEVDMPISRNSNERDVAKTLLNLHYQALTDIYNSLDYNAMKQAAKLIHDADIVTLYGRGESLIIAEDLHYKFKRIGLNSSLEALSGFELPIRIDAYKQQVAIIISHYAESNYFEDYFNEIRYQNIPTILITANKSMKLKNQSNIVINIDNDESHKKLGSFASRTAMQYINDCLYGMVFAMDYDKNRRSLDDYYLRVVSRKTNYK